MSLLDKGAETIIVYPEELVIDVDGNKRTRASSTGFVARARVQPIGQSGTAARRAEQDNEGYESEKIYSVRLTRRSAREIGLIGAQSAIEWRGQRWSLFGDVTVYGNSPRTAHTTYRIKRA